MNPPFSNPEYFDLLYDDYKALLNLSIRDMSKVAHLSKFATNDNSVQPVPLVNTISLAGVWNEHFD